MNILRTNKKKKKMKKVLAGYRKNGSSIEQTIEDLLLESGIPYEREYRIAYKKSCKVYDFCVFGNFNSRILLECDGTYFHNFDYLEGKVSKNSLSFLQKKNLRNDKIKNKLASELGIPLLRLWESEIKSNPRECLEKIKNELNKINSLNY